jgi:enoyl-CoA hydratase
MADFQNIIVETHGRVGLIRLNRPASLNALCDALMDELGTQVLAFDTDPAIGAIVLTGNEKAFAAGADIKEMKDRTHPDAMLEDFIGRRWETVLRVKKPVIAAVAGFALGGGCELAMMCDFILAADTARFGQPEINLGVLPGAGGTQRLTRAVGKSKAMDMILTARMMDAAEAERANLVSRVFPADQLVPEALKIAARIAELSPVAVAFAKQAVNRAFETTLVTARARAVHVAVRHPRPARGHGGVCREAEAGVPVGVSLKCGPTHPDGGTMTKIQIELPEATAKAAREAGLLTSQALDRLLTDAIRRQKAADSLLRIADRVAAAGVEPIPMEEVNAEVKAARAERRDAEQRRRASGR